MSNSRWLALLFVGFALASCGGDSTGDGGPVTEDNRAVEGTAQKGLFQVLEVDAFTLDGSGVVQGDAVPVAVGGQIFSLQIAEDQLTLFEASGTFTSEITGETIVADKPLKLLIAPGGENLTANINVATTLVAERVLNELRSSGGDPATLIQKHTDFVNAALGFAAGTDPTQLDFNNIAASSDLADANLQLLILSGGIVQTLSSDQLYAGGFQNIVDGIVAAENLEQAAAVLSILNGLSADVIYALAVQYSGIQLPALAVGNTFYVWICDAGNQCEWLEVTEPAIIVSGTSAWEADGKARVFVRVNEAPSSPLTVRFDVLSGTATAGEDFLSLTPGVTIPVGHTSVPVEVELIIDALSESTEQFRVSITSDDEGYAVLRGVADVSLRDGVKPTANTLANRDAAGLDLAIDVASVCNLVVNASSIFCQQLTGSETFLGIIEGRSHLALTSLDVTGDCVALGKCDVDWIVDLFLVAKSNGSNASEVPLGAFVYPAEKVHLAGEPGDPAKPFVRLADDTSLALANEAAANGWTLEIEARIGSTNTVAAAQPLPSFVDMPGTVMVGDSLLSIGVIYDVMPGADFGCATAQYAINAQYQQTGGAPVPAGLSVIAALTAFGEGTICVDFDPDDPGSGATMVEGRLDIFGGSAANDAVSAVYLPEGLYAQISLTVPGRGQTVRTSPALLFLPGSTVLLSNALHANGWPFLFDVNSVSLTAQGIELGYGNMRYVMDPGYSSQDPRSLGILYSNDIYYRGVEGQGGSLILGPNGVTGAISVAGGPGHADHTAFPRARVEWQGFTQELVDSQLQATTVVVDEYRLSQDTTCSGPECVQGQKDEFDVTGIVALDGKGFAIGDTTIAGTHAVPRWGARADGEFAWSRPTDLATQGRLKLAVPGYRYSGDQVSDALIAHLNEPAVPGDIEMYPHGSEAFVDGNYHPVGLSYGPETYRDGSGAPQQGDGQNPATSGTMLRLDNGQDAPADLRSAPAVKYVIRNSGITGVFNVDSNSLTGAAPQFYGYNFNMSRFAVRTVDNTLDPYNWIDGHIELNGEAGGSEGFDVWFSNLEIDCSAKLHNLGLTYEACDAQDNNGNGAIDENCTPELKGWSATTDIFAARFTGVDTGASCAVGPQRFKLQHQVNFAALDKPVAFETEWDNAGMLREQASGQLPNYRFDRSDEGEGFPLKTSSVQNDDVMLGTASVGGESYGWLEMKQSLVGVPFWNALDTDLRIANAYHFGEIDAEPTVVVKEGELAGLPTALRNKDVLRAGNEASENRPDSAIKAQYEWGRTGFGFKLPVYYQPWQLDNGRSDADAQGRQSRFLGRQLTKDLFVLDANAGINFIEPDRTKLSFGASADFTRLEGVQFQIDITDAASAAAVDDALQNLRITRGPLFEPAVSGLLDTVYVVNRLASRGLDELMQETLELAVEELGEAAAPLTPNNQDPFVTASELLTQFQSMPQQVTALIENEVQGPLNNQLAALKGQLRESLLDAEAAIRNIDGNESPAERLEKIALIKNTTAKVIEILDEIESKVRAVDVQLTANLNFATDVLSQGMLASAEIVTAMDNINLVMRQATEISSSACSGGLKVVESGAGFLLVAAQRVAAVREAIEFIQTSDAWLDAAASIANDAEVTRQLNLARQRIRDASAEVVQFIDNADQAISDIVCHPAQLAELVAYVEEFTDKVKGAVNGAQQNIVAAAAALQQAEAVKTLIAERIYEPINTVRSALQPEPNNDDPGNGARLNQIISCILYRASHDSDGCSIFQVDVVPDVTTLYGINALANNGGNERDIADALFHVLEVEINDKFNDVKEELADATAGLIPGAYMNPEQLRRLLVTEIMRSEPVKTLREEMDKHFAEVAYAVNNISLQLVDQINAVIEGALATVAGPINDALSEATTVVRNIPLQSAGITGFATIAGNELERAHLSAGWTMRGSDDNDATEFKAALDAESWSARHTDPDENTPNACAVGDGDSRLDVKISAYGLPIKVMAANIIVEKLYLGFTLESNSGSGPALKPVGIFGGINTIGEIGFSEAIVFDPAFAAALGLQQTYIGASAGAVFSSLTADVAFLVGRVCPGNTALTDLDPNVATFLPSLPASGFTGAYLRGGATIPIIPGGCALNVGVVADFGTWIFVGRPTTLGGLVGGGATGQVACIASLKGKVTVGGSVSTDGDLKLAGEGWGVAGAGLCEPGTWTDVPRSREDSWCGTGDAQFGASFENGKWKVNPPKPSAIH